MNNYNSEYAHTKAALNWMLLFYNRCLTDDPDCSDLTIDEMDVLYCYDVKMIELYQMELVLLEARFILGIIC